MSVAINATWTEQTSTRQTVNEMSWQEIAFFYICVLSKDSFYQGRFKVTLNNEPYIPYTAYLLRSNKGLLYWGQRSESVYSSCAHETSEKLNVFSIGEFCSDLYMHFISDECHTAKTSSLHWLACVPIRKAEGKALGIHRSKNKIT